MTRQMDIAMGGPGASPEQVTAAAEDLLRGQGARGPRDAAASPGSLPRSAHAAAAVGTRAAARGL